MKKILILFCVLMTGIGAFAQSAVTASGGEASGNSGNLSYSIGQTFCSANSGTSGLINEGVQHPYEIYDVTDVQSAILEEISLSAFPNPTSNYLTLRIENDDIEGFDCTMYDISGKEILQKRITSSETSLDMNSLPSATYFVRVTKQNREVKTFKIVKN
ncbi:MAG: T9SS type A sorting domain-containing protein [Bacteroidales bacterium]|nr:T9SS type A sorting domain-containing protein [Bacteroidales bacterium]